MRRFVLQRRGDDRGIDHGTTLRGLAELDRLQPGPALDRAVMRQAREAIALSQRTGDLAAPGWLAPIARAAAASAVTAAVIAAIIAAIVFAGLHRAAKSPAAAREPALARIAVGAGRRASALVSEPPPPSLVSGAPPTSWLVETSAFEQPAIIVGRRVNVGASLDIGARTSAATPRSAGIKQSASTPRHARRSRMRGPRAVPLTR